MEATDKKDDEKIIEESESSETFYIVGIGASAGGLEALEEFFKNMPSNSSMAFVVVQHLSPDYKSLMAELLSKHTQMQVAQAKDGDIVKPNTVYLIPPKKNMTIFHGKLLLIDQDHSGHYTLNLPIDIFFRSLAEDMGERSIAIVLSGTGTDGTRGIRAIKEAGGMVMVQDAESAKFDGMPNSAISTRLADYILPPSKMPTELSNFTHHPYAIPKPDADIRQVTDGDSLTKIFAILRRTSGVDFTYYKPSTVVRRIERRMSINQIDSLDEYLKHISSSPMESAILFKELLIGVTKFFRDAEAFDSLHRDILPQLFKERATQDNLRVWVAGCSTGEEAYSIAILIREYMGENNYHNKVKIFATDIDKEAIEFGGTGIYPDSIAADVSEDRLRKFFIKRDHTYQITSEIREMVVFAPHNITKDPPFSKIDLITCRNLLIYLQSVLQRKVLSLFNFALNTNGFLFLGSSETVGDMGPYFITIDSKNKLYQYKGGGKPNIGEAFSASSLRENKSLAAHAYEPSWKRNAQQANIEILYESLLNQFVPPCVFIDENNKIIHVLGDINPYIRFQSGRIDLDIVSMAKKDLSVAIGTSISKAMRANEELIYRDIKIEDGNVISKLNLIVKPVTNTRTGEKLAIVIFEPVASKIEASSSEPHEFNAEEGKTQRMNELEKDLKYTKENLQATIEELETSNEELQATNEELIASNEELQSTNEELQSVNEELITVNSEHQMKIQELTELNNDMDNLLKTTDMGVIFLDKDLRIRKFTPAVTKEINMIDLDIGRPVTDIAHHIEYKAFFDDAREVLRTLAPKEMEVRSENGDRYIMRILPYRTSDNYIKGVVITLLNIENISQISEDKQRLEIFNYKNPSMISVSDESGRINFVNQKFLEKTKYSAKELIGKTYDEIGIIEPPFRNIEKNLNKSEEAQIFEIKVIPKEGESFIEEVSFIPTIDENGDISEVFKISRDVSQNKELEKNLKKEQNRFAGLIDISPTATVIISTLGEITYANRRAEELLELSKDEIKSRAYNSPEWENIDMEGNPLKEEDYPFVKIMREKKPLYDMKHGLKSPKDGRIKYISVSGTPVFDEDSTSIIEAVFTINSLDR